jgi:nitrite reductase/ring-hydroxylating ferredoxin subunit
MQHVIHRAALAENAVLGLELAGTHLVVADVDGDVRAFAVTGPAGRHPGLGSVAEGYLRCPLHGWPIDPHAGRCGAAEFCRYDPLVVEVDADEIRIQLPVR